MVVGSDNSRPVPYHGPPGILDSATDPLGVTSFRVSARAQVYPAVDLLPFRYLIRGIPPNEAAAYLASQLDLASPPTLRLHPFRLPRLPVLATRITIEWIWEAD